MIRGYSTTALRSPPAQPLSTVTPTPPQMERKQIRSSPVYNQLPPLSVNYPWLVARNLQEETEEDDGEHIFYTVLDPMSHYRCRIPELVGRHIRGCFHGWVILSTITHGDKWYLWNPITSKLIRLPRLIMKDGGDSHDIFDCCLSSPPDHPGSVILLTRKTKPNFVFCRLDRKRKRLRWTEMSYSRQLSSITGEENGFLIGLTCCNGKVYSLIDRSVCIVHIQIVVNNKQVVIRLFRFASLPDLYPAGCCWHRFLKGSSQELFVVVVGFKYLTKEKPIDMCLHKLDMTSMVWAEMKELKGTVFFVDMTNWDLSVICSPAIASELGGYIHLLHETGKVIYSYDVKDKSISVSSMKCLDLPPRSRSRSRGLPTSHISVWTMPEFRLKGDDGEAKCKSDAKQDEEGKEDEMVVRIRSAIMNDDDEVEFSSKTNESELLNIFPFHVLEMIMEFCIGVEYLNFRATCKRCHLAAPVIRWSNERIRLQTYSLSSPWLMELEKDQGIISFTDPMFGDKYFIKAASQELFYDDRILCSRYGWLLLFIGNQRMVFFNPFTSDIRELPHVPHLHCFCFSAPPTSPDCMVVGFITGFGEHEPTIYLHSVGREPSWRIIRLDLGGADSLSLRFPTFCGRDVYALSHEGGLHVFKDDNSSLETVIAEAPRSCCCRASNEYFLMKCDQHILLVVVVDFGEFVEVFKLKDSSWEKMHDLGRHMIYICGATCVCMDAIRPEMENKIYFPLLHSKNEKMVFYSLETCRYHTFKGRDVDENLRDVFETKQNVYAQAWIEPSWPGLVAS